MKTFKNVCLIISSIIGAGFASGKEIFVYFSKYGYISIFFILPLFFLFYFGIYFIMNNNIFLSKNKVFNYFSIICFCIVSSAMIAGINSMFEIKKFSFIYFIFNLLLIIICFFVINKNINLLKNIGTFLVPMILIVIILIDIFLLLNKTTITLTIPDNVYLLPFTSIMYVSLNLYMSNIVIFQCAKGCTKKQMKFTSFFSSFILCLLICLAIIVEIKFINVSLDEVPYLKFAKTLGNFFYVIFYIVFFCSIITTLFSTLYSFKNSLYFKSNNLNIVICLLLSFSLSIYGFSNLVNYLYPIISIIGIIVFIKYKLSAIK